MSESSYYAERNAARKERTVSRRKARQNKAATLRAFTPATARTVRGA